MKVIVTGGAGSIGCYVVKKLLERGDEVLIIDDFNDFYDPEFKRFRLNAMLSGLPMPKIEEVDIKNEAEIDRIFSEFIPDKVIHLAAWAAVRPSVENPLLYTQANVDGTVNIFQASQKNKVKNVVFASSSSVYGRNFTPPFTENVACDTPIAPYAASKRSGELYAWMFNYLYDLPIICLRFFTVYGPWIRPDMATWKFTEKIHKDEEIPVNKFTPEGKEVKRDFTYIDDIVSGIISALDKNSNFDIVNLGNDDPVTLSRFVSAIEAGLGKKAKIVEKLLPIEEAAVTAAELTHAREVLDYEPETSIEEGIKKFVDWYLSTFIKEFPEGLKKSNYF